MKRFLIVPSLVLAALLAALQTFAAWRITTRAGDHTSI